MEQRQSSLSSGREAWTDTVNRSLERSGMEERIDHRSHAARGLDEQPTVHEGVIAQALERKGIVSDRCELNRQIKADNALLRELKAQVNKLLQAIKNTIPALAEAIESLREKMIVFRYQVRHILSGKEHIEKNLKILQPELTRYIRIAEQIKKRVMNAKHSLPKRRQRQSYRY
ncbi:MAG: MobA/MobL family protein [Oscillospiraceae bacterium]